jgi:mannose-6-phosphate isomerase-like protein (cupin superfamily)
MQRTSLVTVIAILIFAAGFVAARNMTPAGAAPLTLTPQLIDLTTLTADDLSAPNPGGTRIKTLVIADGATLQVQMGPTPKHFHADANEIQYVVDSSGTEWLGDRQVVLKPGDLLLIPKGTTHGGLIDPSGKLKLIAIKTPPQADDDFHIVP